MKHLGNFEVTSGKIIVTDPCYQFDEDNVISARSGKWEALIDYDAQGHVSELLVRHIHCQELFPSNTELDVTCPVDSGQAGVFDADRYAQHQGGSYNRPDTFYGQCCQLTNSNDGGIVVEEGTSIGAVSTTGYGDGNYIVEGWYHRGELVGVQINFVDED